MAEPVPDALAERQGGLIYFDSSLLPAQFISVSTKFYQAAASSGAAIAIVGAHSKMSPNSNSTNVFYACEFSGLASSNDGGSILLVNTTATINLCGFLNTFAVSGASCVETINSTGWIMAGSGFGVLVLGCWVLGVGFQHLNKFTVTMSSNSYNFTGRPQVFANLGSNVTDSSSYYSNGGNFCPIAQCTPALLKNGNCNPVCNISLCDYDGGDCVCPIDKCPISSRGNGVCDIGCATAGCFYDDGDCCDVELCPLHLRDNKKCDTECNNKACEYDGGECTVPNNSTKRAMLSQYEELPDDGVVWTLRPDGHMEKSHFESKFRSSSVLKNAVGSKVLNILDSYKKNVVKTAHSSRLHVKAFDSDQQPSAIKCSGSFVSIRTVFIDQDPGTSSVQVSGCTGLRSCGGCDLCSRCSSNGCDSSYNDAFCRSQFGSLSKCQISNPSPENNFTKMTCSKPIPKTESSENNTGLFIVVAIGALCCVGLIGFSAWKYRTFRRDVINNGDPSQIAVDHASLQTTASTPRTRVQIPEIQTAFTPI